MPSSPETRWWATAGSAVIRMAPLISFVAAAVVGHGLDLAESHRFPLDSHPLTCP